VLVNRLLFYNTIDGLIRDAKARVAYA